MDDEIVLEPVWKAADALKEHVLSLTLTNVEKHLLLETIYLEFRVLYLQEDLESGYEHIEEMDDALDYLVEVLHDAIEELYEFKDVLDLEELIERLGSLWFQTESHELSLA